MILRRVNEVGMKNDFETKKIIKSVQFLSALSHISFDDFANAFELYSELMPEHNKNVRSS